MEKIKKLLVNLTAPQSEDSDVSRREFVLNILLVSWMIIAIAAFLVSGINYLRLGNEFDGGSPLYILLVFGLFAFLYFLSRKNHSRTASNLLVLIIFLIAAILSFIWGALLPLPLTMYSLVIIIAGVLVSWRSSLYYALVVGSYITGLAYLQEQEYLSFQNNWQFETVTTTTILINAVIMGIIAIVAWLGNHELYRALNRARQSEKALARERDLLESRVEERTRELRELQLKQMAQIYRFAEIGRSASGYFHDLSNPLTAVSLNLEHLKNKHLSDPKRQSELAEVNESVQRALENTKKMERFMRAARKSLVHSETLVEFSVRSEIEQAIEILGYRANKRGVRIKFSPETDIKIKGSPLKFNRAISNLITNAIDAYPEIEKNFLPTETESEQKPKLVEVSLRKDGKTIEIRIKDYGRGIKDEHKQKIFEPLFTTKSPQEGTGLGLSITRKILEEDFSAKISFSSEAEKGTEFLVEVPELRGVKTD